MELHPIVGAPSINNLLYSFWATRLRRCFTEVPKDKILECKKKNKQRVGDNDTEETEVKVQVY